MVYVNLVIVVVLSFCTHAKQIEGTETHSASSIWIKEAETKSVPKKTVASNNLPTKKQQPRFKLSIMPIHFTSKIAMSALKQHLLKSLKDIEIANRNEVKDFAKGSPKSNKNLSDFQNKSETTDTSLPKTYLLRILPNQEMKAHRRNKRNPTEEGDSVDELNDFFANLRDNDDDTCLARMVCEMATGHPAFGQFGHDITEVLLSLESDNPSAPWRYYKRAAFIGRRARSGHTCARRYSICRASFEDLVSVSRCLEQGEQCFDQ